MKSQITFNPLIVKLSRYLVAALFIFSGFAKGINPFGLSIQLSEYFNVLNISFLSPLAWLFAILLPAAEMLLGFMLLFDLARRLAAWGVLLFMGFFSLLTLWIALYNPVNDCGCFGDLLKISNTATFLKNIVFLIPTAIIFLSRNNTKRKPSKGATYKWCAAIILSLFVPIYTTFTLPLIDATPYKIGINIPQAMEIPLDAPQSVQQTTLIYKNLQSGKTQEFTVSDTTWHDTSKWEFVDSRTETIVQGYVPPIASFPMLDRFGNDLSAELLKLDNLLIVLATDLQYIDISKVRAISGGWRDGRVVVLTSAPLAHIDQSIEAYNSDYSLIRTVIQYPKGGAVLLRRGTIIKKWAMPYLPANL